MPFSCEPFGFVLNLSLIHIYGLLRENFPQKTNFSTVTQRDLYWKGVYRINNRPGKVLGWKTAQECFAEELRNSA